MMNSLLLICAFQSLFLSVLVFLKRRKNLADNVLAAWLLVIAIHMLLEYLQFYNYDHGYPYPWLIGIDVTFSMLHPILVFIYILTYTRLLAKRWNGFWHLTPFFLMNLILIKPYYSLPPEEKIAEYNSIMNGNGYIHQTFEYLTFVIMAVAVGYLAACLVYLNRHRRNLRQQLSSVKGLELLWLNVLLIIMGGVLMAAVILEIFTNTLQIISPEWGSAIVFVAITIGIFYIGIHGILQTANFSGYNPGYTNAAALKKKSTSHKKRGSSILESSREKVEMQYDRLVTFMESEKPFLETDLHLSGLAEMLDLKPHYLSALINRMSGKNFFDFVNLFRINEFKKQVLEPGSQKYTMMSIAYGCGFNSKTTFNRAFKHATGQTPSEYFKGSSA